MQMHEVLLCRLSSTLFKFGCICRVFNLRNQYWNALLLIVLSSEMGGKSWFLKSNRFRNTLVESYELKLAEKQRLQSITAFNPLRNPLVLYFSLTPICFIHKFSIVVIFYVIVDLGTCSRLCLPRYILVFVFLSMYTFEAFLT